MKTVKIVVGIVANAALIVGIISLFSNNDKAFAALWVSGCILTIVFLRIARIGDNTVPQASKFAKKYL